MYIFIQEQTQKCGQIVFRTFDPVIVQLSLDSNNVQHEKIILKLIKPEIPNFSIPSITESTTAAQLGQKNLSLCEPSYEPQCKKAKV